MFWRLCWETLFRYYILFWYIYLVFLLEVSVAYRSPLILQTLARNLKMYFEEIIGQANLTVSNFSPLLSIKIHRFRTKLQNWVGFTIQCSKRNTSICKIYLNTREQKLQRFLWLGRWCCVLHSRREQHVFILNWKILWSLARAIC